MKSLVAILVVAVTMGWSAEASADSATFCANEHGFCHAPTGAWINYGNRGAFFHRRSPRGGLPCDNSVFGDPLPGTPKKCTFNL